MAEGRWLFRRLYAFAVSAGLWVLLMRTVGRMPAEMLPRITDGLMGLLALILAQPGQPAGALLLEMAKEMAHPAPAKLVAAGMAMLDDLLDQGLVLGGA